ncbi:hypothetical protein A1O3_07405 [Capronia epimyces CBS 606.96]|uniref:SHSP domain-containing protein n=1 Tax=Capronia epimyces CBS 606.96 TaxID=1182542 RepID=W9XKR2_9EURO|nr:uncharacterized protein A1O3_07405 [Capronia epimyces CBS 606.96]EXJ81117.1 hypothetical protein A1O3_07405 [Capronia epimyces CBS 606.96]
MAFLYTYPEVEPYPTTYVPHTYPEKGQHLPHIPLPYLAHKAHRLLHDKDQEIHIPKADLRETRFNFYIEVELPGISDKSQLHLRWTSMRTLLVTSKIVRPEIPESELFDIPIVGPASEPAKKEADTTPPAADPQQQEQQEPTATAAPPLATVKKEPHLTVHERQIGGQMRGFNFPVDLDRDNTHAKLDAGLLRIVVPKLHEEHTEPLHVTIKT